MKSLKDIIVDKNIKLTDLLDLYYKVPDAFNLKTLFVERYGEMFVNQRGDIFESNDDNKIYDFARSLESGVMYNYCILLTYSSIEENNKVYELIPARMYPNEFKRSYLKLATIEGILPVPGTRGFMSYDSIDNTIIIPLTRSLWFLPNNTNNFDIAKNKLILIIVTNAVKNLFSILGIDEVELNNGERLTKETLIEDIFREFVEENEHSYSIEFKTPNQDYDVTLYELTLYEVQFP